MRIGREYDVNDWQTQVSSYIDSAIRRAIAAGLTAAAERVREDLIAELESDIDRPTPFKKQGIASFSLSWKTGGDPDD